MNSISIFQKFHIEDYDFENLVITSEIFDRNLISRSNSNHLSASRIFQNFYQIFSELIVLFYSLDQLNISSRNFRNISSNNQHWNHFFYSKVDHRTYLLIIANRHLSFATKIASIIEFENQSIFRQNFQYWQFYINIWIILDFWKFSKITSVDLANQFRFFNICDEIDNISHIFDQYFDKNSVLKSYNFFENITKSYLFQ